MTGPGLRRLDPGGDARLALRLAGMEPSPWTAGPGTAFAPHRHDRTKHLYLERGSITFRGPAFGEIALEAGDGGIEIPAGTEHSALAGASGVSCVEGFGAQPVPRGR
ncbi:MAG TPA: cupin domain-containing protein [Candidatus Dormibacteraeota bacterium]|nr:cupin domain-containing protein [Candidatus Dormibacteraeota bacterium]